MAEKGMSDWTPPEGIENQDQYWKEYWRERAERDEQRIKELELELATRGPFRCPDCDGRGYVNRGEDMFGWNCDTCGTSGAVNFREATAEMQALREDYAVMEKAWCGFKNWMQEQLNLHAPSIPAARMQIAKMKEALATVLAHAGSAIECVDEPGAGYLREVCEIVETVFPAEDPMPDHHHDGGEVTAEGWPEEYQNDPLGEDE